MPVAAQSGVVAVFARWFTAAALKHDGSVVTWGGIGTNVPASAKSGVVSLAVGGGFMVALKDDGSVVAWGENRFGQTNVPASAQSGVVAVAASNEHILALKRDGSVVAWGANHHGQVTGTPTTTYPGTAIASPVTLAGQVLSGVTAIAANTFYSVALQNDGSVVAWGNNRHGQTNVPVAAQSGVVAMDSETTHVVALKNDGTVVAWGSNGSGDWSGFGQADVPAGLSGVTAISAGLVNTMAVRGSGWELNTPSADASATVTSTISPNGIDATVILDGSRSSDPDGDPLQYTWYENGAPLAMGVVAHPVLLVGTHTIALVVNDGRFSATDATAVEVITPATAVRRLARLVENAGLGTRNQRPLLATLFAARSAFDRGNVPAALNQLSAFQNQVHAQIAPRNPALADLFITVAQQIISALRAR